MVVLFTFHHSMGKDRHRGSAVVCQSPVIESVVVATPVLQLRLTRSQDMDKLLHCQCGQTHFLGESNLEYHKQN